MNKETLKSSSVQFILIIIQMLFNYKIVDGNQDHLYNQMQNQQLLLLQLLKVPVFVIRKLSTLLFMVTYIPNYLFLYVVDHFFVFNDRLTSDIRSYCLSWIFRFAFLNLGIAFFVAQFYGFYLFLDIGQQSAIVQLVGFSSSFGGLAFIMRKGYLKMIAKYHLKKLKSPMQHAEQYGYFMVDFLTLFLTIVNALMVVNIKETLSYNYSPTYCTYIKHVMLLIRASMIHHIEIFYLKLFFRAFPWRFRRQMLVYQKQKQQNNALNCFVLLTLIFGSTLLDIAVVLVFGLPAIVHHKRKVYYKNMTDSHQKSQVTINHFGFIMVQYLCLIVAIACLPFQFELAKKIVKELYHCESTKEVKKVTLGRLIKKTALKIPYLFCLFWIFLLRYKYNKKNMIINQIQKGQIPTQEEEMVVMRCFKQQLKDTLFLPLILVATLLRPWNYYWLTFAIDDRFDLRHQLILRYCSKCAFEPIFLMLSIPISMAIMLYNFKRPKQLFSQSGKEIRQLYLMKCKKQASTVNQKLITIDGESQCFKFLIMLVNEFKASCPHLPAFFTFKIGILYLFNTRIQPKQVPHQITKLNLAYYFQSVKKNQDFEFYQELYTKNDAAGTLKTEEKKLSFWRHAKKCQRYKIIHRIIKIFLPKYFIKLAQKQIKKSDNLSEISSIYWLNYDLTFSYFKYLFFFVVEMMLTLIGVIFLLPLTLWRMPTFIILFKHKKQKRYFFAIILKVYKQMGLDLLLFFPKILALLLSPKHFITFVYQTSFRYGNNGHDSFSNAQKNKHNYLWICILRTDLIKVKLVLKMGVICVLWLRFKGLKIKLRAQKLKIRYFFKDIIFGSVSCISFEEMMASPVTQQSLYQLKQFDDFKLKQFEGIIDRIYSDAIKDLPFIFLSFVFLVMMPWRVNHILKAVKQMREDANLRLQLTKFYRHIVRDYFCIFLTIFFLLSGIKSKKAFQLIKRNIKLNFFVGFMEYSYYRQLIAELISIKNIYYDIVLSIMAVLFGWTKAPLMFDQLRGIYKKDKQYEEAVRQNEKIRQDTVKTGKELEILSRMGFYAYLNVCSYLTISDVVKLRMTSKFNYQMTKKEEIWFVKWQKGYVNKYNISADTFEKKCITAFKQESLTKQKQPITYHQVILKHYKKNVRQQNVDLKMFTGQKIRQSTFDKLFKGYRYSVTQGFGPEHLLPQTENEDEEYLRLTGQARIPKIEFSQLQAYQNWFFYKPLQIVCQKVNRYFRVDRSRRKKQLSLLLSIVSLIAIYLASIWLFFGQIFSIGRLIFVKVLFIGYFHLFLYYLLMRCQALYVQGWVSLKPFDLKSDFIQWGVQPFKKLCRKIALNTKKLTISIKNKIQHWCNILADKIRRFWNILVDKIKSALNKTSNIAMKYGTIVYDNIVKPLYLKISSKIRLLKNALVSLTKSIILLLKWFVSLISNLFQSTYQGIKMLFSNLNNLYYTILKVSMINLLKFGILGNLVFTVLGLLLMMGPSILCYVFYWHKWLIITTTIQSVILTTVGYKHLNKIRKEPK